MPDDAPRIAVLMGGPSAEREVSLRSGRAVAEGLGAAGYRVLTVDVTGPCLAPLPADVAAVFIALHGAFGEDGQVQALLEARGMPYTGSGVEASRLAFDKARSKRRFDEAGVMTPAWAPVRDGRMPDLPLPLVVKPCCQGSTIGIHKVDAAADWAAAVADASRHGEVLAEVYVPGRELTVGVVGATVLPIVEITAPDNWYDYDAKYAGNRTVYHAPAALPAATADAIRGAAWRAFDCLGCRGLGRVDLRWSPDGAAYVLEVNTIPGFTRTSLLPKAAAAAGLTFVELCERILRPVLPAGGSHGL